MPKLVAPAVTASALAVVGVNYVYEMIGSPAVKTLRENTTYELKDAGGNVVLTKTVGQNAPAALPADITQRMSTRENELKIAEGI